MKDKISSGQFLLIVHALDRIGGNRIPIDVSKTEAKYRILAKNLREFAVKKRTFLNSENRQVISNQNGQQVYKGAAQTGIGFFKA
jgi:hypothetical protein